MSGIFIAPATGNYTWFAAADDRLSIAIGEDETTESLREVLRLNQFRGVPREPEDSPATFYYFAQDAPDPLWPSERQQISEPVELLAGRRYAFRLRFVQQDRVDYQRIALKVSGLSPSSEAARLSAAASPAMELQRLRLRASPALKRETWFIRVADSREGFWMTLVGSVTQSRSYIRGGTDMMGFCNEVKKSLNDITHCSAVQSIFYAVQCSRAAAGEHGWNQTVVLECLQAEGERTKIKKWQITESAAGAEAGLVQNGSLGIGGEFRVGFDGLWSGAVPALSCESDKLSEIGRAHV